MKIVFTGGGTGGHFYPIIAIARALNKQVKEGGRTAKLYFFSVDPYDTASLEKENIIFKHIPAGKIRLYFSPQNFLDIIKIFWGAWVAIIKLFFIYPDVVFGKGGYASFPTLLAARILRIPVIIHESDTIPGRVNRWAGKFAARVALSYPEAHTYFPQGKTAVTGQPIREELFLPYGQNEPRKIILEEEIPTIAVIGGSQGAHVLNDTILDVLPILLPYYNVLHQTGGKNFEASNQRAQIVLQQIKNGSRYHAFPFFDAQLLREVAHLTDIFISRSGSMIFEIAAWGKPSILIPISEEVSRDQTKNAFSYARTGGAVVIEEKNLTPHILEAELRRIASSQEVFSRMQEAARNFSKEDAALKIALEIVRFSLKHE